jgi:regulator of protease activity HflC (stomatin/prohibitin superfamily)
MNTQDTPQNRELVVTLKDGWFMLVVNLGLLLGSIAFFIFSIAQGIKNDGPPNWPIFMVSLLVLIWSVIMMVGFFTLQPKEARVLILFGDYRGTVKKSGFHWGNPFYSNGSATAAPQSGSRDSGAKQGGSTHARHAQKRHTRNKISLRSRNLNGERLKVNDKRGNPIEIAAVVVWRVEDTAQAMFDVEDFENYVEVQSESAVRHLASNYAYDHGEENEITLRSNVDEISQALQKELQERLGKAGVVVEEARLTHLAYAPEIAQAMLRRQQAEAVIAARKKIVQGAVSMVHMALNELADKEVVHLDDERRAAMVSNLMVVLCGDSEVQPVLNTGTLYH